MEMIFFHKPFTRLFRFFVRLFPVEKTWQCVWVPGKLSFQEGENSVEALFEAWEFIFDLLKACCSVWEL